jgi:YVTN family beta-propeller protein
MKYKHGFINVLFGTPIRIWFVALLGIALGSTFVQAQPFAYVANFHSKNVSVIDTSNNTVTANVSVNRDPKEVAVTPDGKFVYLTNSGSKNVSVIDTSNNTVTANVSVGSYPIAVAVIGPEGVDLSITNRGSPNPVKVSTKLIYTPHRN